MHALGLAFNRIMKRVGVVGSVAWQGHGEGRTTSTLRFHRTRHYFVSQLSAGGVKRDILQRLAGHNDSKTHAGYAKHEIELQRAAVSTLPNISAHG